jgi:predicted amidophosphoribosyltransferase
MALIKCPGCRNEVSDEATICPNCGAPLTPIPDSVSSKRAGGTWNGVGFALVAAGIVIGVLSNRLLGCVMALGGVAVMIVGRRK